jgi:hypothetical protein
MDSGIFEFVLVIVVEDDAVLVDEAHYWGHPAGASQEVHDYVEKPILHT